MDGEKQDLLYLNPLTLEAQWFLESLRMVGKTGKQIDPNLCKVLIAIMQEIENYMSGKPIQIVATENTKFVDNQEFRNIKRSFSCASCSHKTIGQWTNISQAVVHLAKNHKEKVTEKKLNVKSSSNNSKYTGNIVLPKKAKALVMHTNLEGFFADNLKIGEKLKKLPEYQTIEKELLESAKAIFPEEKRLRVYRFGSRISGIGTRTSDLDIFVEIGKSFYNFENRASAQTLTHLQTVRKMLVARKEWKLLACIESARVPIIKVCHISTGIECDIGFSNSLGYCNTKLAEHIFSMQPLARYMCIYLKKWLDRTKLGEHISTYSMTLMIFYFLQILKLLPSVEKMQMELDKGELVGPWISNFMNKPLVDYKIERIDVNASDVRTYLRDFFEYYACFKYDTNVVCPYFGLSNIEICAIERAMPKRYTLFVDAHPDFSLQLKKHMIVQDPIQLNHNVTKAVTPFVVEQFVTYCQQTAALLRNGVPKQIVVEDIKT